MGRLDGRVALVTGAGRGFGRLDILVNNAGVMTRGQFLDVPIASYESMLAVNVTGTFLCTQRALRPMVAARYGRIINFSTQLDRRTAVPARCTTVSSSPPAAPGRS